MLRREPENHAWAAAFLAVRRAVGSSSRQLLISALAALGLAAVNASWLARTREWTTRLHHLELLTEAQARAELRAGADLHAAAHAGGATPVSIAREILGLSDGDDEIAAAVPRAGDDNTPGVAAARLVLRAKQKWSKDNHALFPAAARARAVELMSLGSMLSHDPRFTGVAMRDIWHAYTVETVRRSP